MTKQFGPMEDLEEMNIDLDRPEQVVHVEQKLSKGLKHHLQKLLATHRNAFARTHADMPGIDLRVITHRLSVNPLAKLVRQKKRTFAPDRN